ncbi:UDP-glucuronosyltransferase 1-2-like [Boleophthalmus pectinirostris]|uniref:UDP-glucuronosyltransferase 1-2-like n=1 Tax=Boleophthalmus pectinirostris TaxID=150288 RepID=UPI00243183C2|nr:UDP-glucuronosyltransferase 1-2-like [Boleophthalmus pectinirostris]
MSRMTTCLHMKGMGLLFILCLMGFAPSCDGGNILVLSLDGSHWVNMQVLLEELHARGHSITILRSSGSWYIKEQSDVYSTINLPSKMDLKDFGVFLERQFQAQVEGISALISLAPEFLSIIMKLHEMWRGDLIYIFNNKTLLKELKDTKYDLMLTDPGVGTGVILARYLKLPLVLNTRWFHALDVHFLFAPSPLSYIPVTGSGLTDKMSFFQRVQNVLYYSVALAHEYLVTPSYNAICEKYVEEGCNIVKLMQDADIWLFRSDFVFDFPRPTMPNVIYIAGYSCKPLRALSAELEDFMQSAGEHGVIVMTMGCFVNALPIKKAEEIASVFSKLPQKVIWRHLGARPSTLGNNTLLVDWMPQKDLLGHPQTKVFVAHGGTNGVQEAIYHGVPVLGIPLFFDQFDNLLRLQDRGAGTIIRLSELNGDTFEKGLKELLHQEHYRDNMQRLSRLHRDQPLSSMDQAVFWVEYVIRHKGAPHLRTQAYQMPWYSFYSVDVLLLLLSAVTGTVLCVVALFRLLCCRNRTKIKQQ